MLCSVIHSALSNPLAHLYSKLQIVFTIMSATSTTALMSATEAQNPRRFTMAGLAVLQSSTFAQGFSNNERQAAARALLRHDVHIDGTHYQTRTFGGLHPSYLAFHSIPQPADPELERTLSHNELREAALQDVFDAVSEPFLF
jgi:hypothetical protein